MTRNPTRRPTGKRSTVLVDGLPKTTVRGKAGNGEGTLFFANNVGAWRASYEANGKRKWVQGKTREIAEKRRREAIEAGVVARSHSVHFTKTTTVGQFGQWWLDTEVRHSGVRQATVEEYQNRLARLGPLLYERIGDVTQDMLITWLSGLIDTAKPKTVQLTVSWMRSLFRRAVQLGAIKFSPAAEIRAPKVPKSKGRVLPESDVDTMLAAMHGTRDGAILHLLYTKGPRISEALGLSWDDLDLDAGTVTVRRALTYSKRDGLGLGGAKTEDAEGQFYLAPGAVGALRAWRKAQSAERLAAATWEAHTWNGTAIDLVFTTPTGGLVARQNVDRSTRKVAAANKISPTKLGTHVGRRTVITRLSENGVPLDDIAEFIGHREAKTTRGYVVEKTQRSRATAERAAKILER